MEIWVGGLVGAIICALLSYFIASRNNMNTVLWTIVGFLLSIVGLLITFLVAFMKTDDSQASSR